MDAANLALRNGLESEGVLITQVVLGGEGKLHDVIDGSDLLRRYAHAIHLLTIERYILVAVLYNFLQAFALQLAHGFAIHTLHFGVVNHVFFCVWLLFLACLHATVEGFQVGLHHGVTLAGKNDGDGLAELFDSKDFDEGGCHAEENHIGTTGIASIFGY